MKKKDLLDDLLKDFNDETGEVIENNNDNDNEYVDFDSEIKMEKKADKKTQQLQSQQPQQNGDSKFWFKTGDEIESEAKRLSMYYQKKKEKAVPIFHLKVDEQATVVFVDDKGFGVYIHKLKVGDFWESFTCTKDFAPCPICATGNKPSFTVFYTVIDTRPYTNKKGETTKFRKALFPATGVTTQMRLVDEKKAQGGLVGSVCIFKRYSAKESACGTLLENKGKINVAKKFGEENAKPIDYLKVLAPPTQEELDAVGLSFRVVGDVDDILPSDI